MVLTQYSLREIAELIRTKKVSSVEVTQSCLHAAVTLQPLLNCYISIEADDAIEAAKEADRELAHGHCRGPLHGVPMAHKDMFFRAGKVCTGGSDILRNHSPEVTATVVERLYAAGAIWLGTLNMSEFAGNPTGHNIHFGDCHNPWNVAHIPGGSSSGSAAAVAARLCYGALGSDTGGSIRTPAAMCGVCGIKPTYGRVSRSNVLPRARSLDTVGVLCRTAEDCAIVMGVIAGCDVRDPETADLAVPNYQAALAKPLEQLTIGVPQGAFFRDLDVAVQTALDESLATLKELGARIVSVTLPDFPWLSRMSDAITKCELAAFHARWLRTRFADYSPFVRSRIEAGFFIPAERYLQALAGRHPLLLGLVSNVFGSVDAVHLPVTPAPAPTWADVNVDTPGDVPALISKITGYTRPINYLGLPALSVPCGLTPIGLPTAFQLVGRPFSEALLFRIGHAYQQITDWHKIVPRF